MFVTSDFSYKLKAPVSIPLSGQYVCNEFQGKYNEIMQELSQSPYRVNMFVTN